jgi:hypothetical protein
MGQGESKRKELNKRTLFKTKRVIVEEQTDGRKDSHEAWFTFKKALRHLYPQIHGP